MAPVRKGGRTTASWSLLGSRLVVLLAVAVAAWRMARQTATIQKMISAGNDAASQSKKGACQNNDFQPKNNASVFTFVNGDEYVRGAVKLASSIRRFTKTAVDLVALELESKPVPKSDWRTLNRAGWQRCTVSRIPPRNEEKTYPRFRDMFIKLYVWQMEMYQTAVFIDSDALAVAPIDELIHMDLQGKNIGFAQDFFRDWVGTFNAGVFKVHPNQTEFERLLDLHHNDSALVYDVKQSEQGFLNVVYKDLWHDIGFKHNANLAIWDRKREYWDEHKDSIVIIHYTLRKPWKCPASFKEVCSIWDESPPRRRRKWFKRLPF